MIFLDSSYILSLIFENDINHLKAMQIRYVLEDEAKMINNTVLNEVLNINFSDCTILKSMFENNINQIISFDSDFDKIKGIINVNF